MHVVQHNTQYMKLLARQDYSTIYYTQNNSRTCKIMYATEILTLLCLYLRLWSMGSGERPEMQGTSVESVKHGGEGKAMFSQVRSPTVGLWCDIMYERNSLPGYIAVHLFYCVSRHFCKIFL